MPMNVLLMLSSDEEPHPTKVEIPYHLSRCKEKGETWVITTTDLSGFVRQGQLTPRDSTVAFYGDTRLGHHLLAAGKFHEYLPLASNRGIQQLNEISIYENRPPTATGLIRLRHFDAYPLWTPITALNGSTLVAGKWVPLTRNNRPLNQNGIAVLYKTEDPPWNGKD